MKERTNRLKGSYGVSLGPGQEREKRNLGGGGINKEEKEEKIEKEHLCMAKKR